MIEDEARQVSPEQMRGRELEDIKPGGLGVHIIKEIMDEVTYEQRPNQGMRLTLVKHTPEGDEPPTVAGTAAARPKAPTDS